MTVLLHDYQLYAAGPPLRAALPGVTMSHFVHVPFPDPSAWRVLPRPMRESVVAGLLASDVVGFHTDGDAEGFLRLCAEHGREADLETREVACGQRTVRVRAYPISIDPQDVTALAALPETVATAAELARERTERVVLHVARTDPSKNVVRGLLAFDRFLDQHAEWHGRVSLLLLLDPSRLEIPEYAEYLAAILRTAREIGDRWPLPDGRPAVDLRIRDSLSEAIAGYMHYDVLLVNPLFDGMNLVAKEAPLVNERDGVVILSENAGAHAELRPYVLTVNPFDVQEQADAIALALSAAGRGARAARRGPARARARARRAPLAVAAARRARQRRAAAMSEPILIVAALNGRRDRKVARKLPWTPEELAREAKRAVDAGAGVVHVHARKEDGTPAFDLGYDDVIAAIRAEVDVPVSIPTQRLRQTSLATVVALFDALRELPEMATVAVRPLAPDLPAHREEARQLLDACERAGVAPVPIVNEAGAAADVEALYEDGLLARAPFVELALEGPAASEHGLAGTPRNLMRLRETMDGSLAQMRWLAHGEGAASPAVCATAAALGGSIRVGFEDTPLLPDGSKADSNAELVELAVALADALGREPMEPGEARRLLR